MSIKDKINEDFIQAYKEKNMVKKNFLAVLKGAFQLNESKESKVTEKNIIKSFEKGLLENIEASIKLNIDYSAIETELEFLKPYIPVNLTEDEIRVLVKEMISFESSENQGFLIGQFNKANSDRDFDNKIVGLIIREELA